MYINAVILNTATQAVMETRLFSRPGRRPRLFFMQHHMF